MNISTKSIRKIKNLKGKRVIVRVDFNVPIEGGTVTETFRIKKALPTIQYLYDNEAKVILISHLGDSSASLAPVAEYLKKDFPVRFINDIDELSKSEGREVVLLENLRHDPGEEKNSPALAKAMAKLGDIYVNEAFSCSHREHMSIVGLPALLPAYFGFQFEEEVANLSKAFKPKHPFIFILGGAKFSTKAPILKKFLKSADQIYILGAIANSFLMAKGFKVGKSVAEKDVSAIKALAKQKKIILPTDLVVENDMNVFVKRPDAIAKDDVIVDTGPDFVSQIIENINDAQFVLWNGPLGNFEKGYARATKDLAKALARTEAYSIVGGGDTVAAISDLGLEKDFGFLSTAGGAMLDFLAGGTLPAIKAIEKSKVKITNAQKDSRFKPKTKITIKTGE